MDEDALALCVSHAGPVGCASPRYDVFLSFPGGPNASPESFPDRLHASLAAKGVSVCGPDQSQAAGSSWGLSDAAAAWRSKVCIPILSEDYVSSERCLRGLVQMIAGKRRGQQMVLPIFDRVEPSHVRYLTGSFGKAFRSRDGEDIEGVQRALFEVSMLHGWKVTDRREEELVKAVVQTVQRRLRPDLQKVPQIARYNVFLNFRGADTRHGIAYYLYNGLVNAGVSVFKDDTDLPIGEEFGSQLLSAISRSTIYITVISQGYASSKWCLRELMEMMELGETNGHLVVPIFYDVEPRDVRHQRGHFGRAFGAIHEREKDVAETNQVFQDFILEKKRKVLAHLGNLSGFKGDGGRAADGKLTGGVVRATLRELRHRFQLDVPEHLLSIDDRAKSD